MTASTILDKVSQAAGWDTDSQLILALRFIDSQTKVGFLKEWQQFLEQQCDEDNEHLVRFLKKFLEEL